MSKPVTTLTRVTPKMAEEWLNNNPNNRPISWQTVEKLADAIRHDRWHVTNQGIGFGADGSLYDGQHRLWAIVAADRAVDVNVTTGLEPEARAVIDDVKPRRLPDRLAMFAQVPNAQKVVGIANAIYALVYDAQPTFSYETVLAWYAANAPHIDWVPVAQARARGKAPFVTTAVLGALVYAHFRCPAETEAFADLLFSGEGLTAASPILLLREYLIAERTGARVRKDPPRDVARKVLQALHRYVTKSTIRKLQIGGEGLRYFATGHVGKTTLPPPSGLVKPDGGALDLVTLNKCESLREVFDALLAEGVALDDVSAFCQRYHKVVPALRAIRKSDLLKRIADTVVARQRPAHEERPGPNG